MTGYRGFVQSIIRRGWDAYQVTLGIYAWSGEDVPDVPGEYLPADRLLVYRADIAVDDDRTILFPDRELRKCIDAYYDSTFTAPSNAIGRTERKVGEIAAGICSELSDQLLRQKSGRTFSNRSQDPGEKCRINTTGEIVQ